MITPIRKIEHPERAAQVIDLTGISYGTASPTDLDGIIEIRDKMFAIIEMKHSNARPIGYGQRTLIQRTVDALQKSGKVSLGVIGVHETPCSMPVKAAESKAIEVRWNGEWLDLKGKHFSVKDCVDRAFHYAFM